MPKSIKLFLFLTLLFTIYDSRFTVVYADTHTAVSLSTADVKAAVNEAIDGDTVQLPAGISTWTACVQILNKAITFKGAGSDQTTIINACPSLGPYDTKPIYVENPANKPFRITGITILTLDGTT